MATADVDLLVIGGGINGTGVAYDAVGRGLSVCLCEMNDLASATSSASSKLIHGGLRYLEQYEFRLVKEALSEREILLKMAPHISYPLRFCLPHQPYLRPAWMIRAGLFLYDHLSCRSQLLPSKAKRIPAGSPLKPELNKGYFYSDGWVDDARLVILNALGVKARGGSIRTHCKVISAERGNDAWQVLVEDQLSGEQQTITAQAIVNASGPWVDGVQQQLHQHSDKSIRLIKGSHIVVPQLYAGGHAYILQNEDQRVVFVIPYLNDYSLIGTTDVEHTGSMDEIHCSTEEVEYLCGVANDHFVQSIQPENVVWSYAGVRPLVEDHASDAQNVTRDYQLELTDDNGSLPLLTIYGGKLTTYRKLAEQVVNKLSHYFPRAYRRWTATSTLPGAVDSAVYQRWLQDHFPWLSPTLAARYAHSYGLLTEQFLPEGAEESILGHHFGHELYQSEVDYLLDHEWVHDANDLLWRRSKLGLKLNEAEVTQLQSYIQQRKAR